MSMSKQPAKNYRDGRTKQSFANSTDINKIMKRAMKTGMISHLAKHEGVYGDFAEFDFTTAQNTIARANSIFEELPSEVRNEFKNSPGKFFAYANDPENVGRLGKLLPALAEPGRQMLSLAGPPDDPPGTVEEVVPAVPATPEVPAEIETPPPIG